MRIEPHRVLKAPGMCYSQEEGILWKLQEDTDGLGRCPGKCWQVWNLPGKAEAETVHVGQLFQLASFRHRNVQAAGDWHTGGERALEV